MVRFCDSEWLITQTCTQLDQGQHSPSSLRRSGPSFRWLSTSAASASTSSGSLVGSLSRCPRDVALCLRVPFGALALDSVSDGGWDVELLFFEIAVGDGEDVRGRLAPSLFLEIPCQLQIRDPSGFHDRKTYVSLSLRLRLAGRGAVSSGRLFVSSLLSSIARRSCSSSSYAASRLFIVDRRLGLGPSLLRDLPSLERRDVSREEAREEGAGDASGAGGAMGR